MLIASRTDGALKVSLIGEIMGENAWFNSDAADFGAIIAQADGAPLELWVSSQGGSLDAALAMRAMLAEYEGPVSIHVAGFAASAATLLLCIPGVPVIAHRGSVFMIHQASMVTAGNSADMQKAQEILGACDDEIVKVYQLRMKCGEDELRGMIKAETWLRPEEALERGLVSEIAAETSGGYLAEPRNPEPQPDIPEALDNAVSARLVPRIEAIQTGLADISAKGESRARAITDAASAAVSDIAEASGKTVATLTALSEDIGDALAKELQALRDEMAECRRSYDAQAQKYAALDEAISRAYALAGGDLGCTVHDEQMRRAHGFKLNV